MADIRRISGRVLGSVKMIKPRADQLVNHTNNLVKVNGLVDGVLRVLRVCRLVNLLPPQENLTAKYHWLDIVSTPFSHMRIVRT